MADSKSDPAGAKAGNIGNTAFDALNTYEAGSARASLLPIDQAVTAALGNEKERARIEEQLLAAFQEVRSEVAREYLCSKLALVGSDSAVPALARLLADPRLSTAARNALQSIPGKAAPQALRKKLQTSQGLARIGIINSLGARRDADAVSALTGYLRNADPQVTSAAAAALAEIGTVKAGRALRNHFNHTPESSRRNFADPLLVCAGHLREQGNKAEANSLLQLLLTPGQPAFVQQAAERALRS